MPRIRTIKPEFWTSEQVVECSPIARLLFVGLWNFCDDAGNHPASLRRLKMEIFPGDDLPIDEIEGLIGELKTVELLSEYEADGKTYWHVTGWEKHQKIDRPTIRHPLPDGSSSARRAFTPGMEPNGRDNYTASQLGGPLFWNDDCRKTAKQIHQLLDPEHALTAANRRLVAQLATLCDDPTLNPIIFDCVEEAARRSDVGKKFGWVKKALIGRIDDWDGQLRRLSIPGEVLKPPNGSAA